MGIVLYRYFFIMTSSFVQTGVRRRILSCTIFIWIMATSIIMTWGAFYYEDYNYQYLGYKLKIKYIRLDKSIMQGAVCIGRAHHTSPQASINLENSPRKVTYVFGRLRGHIRRPHYQSNQIIRVFGDFWPKSWKTLRHVSGHVTRATWVLKVPCESPWGVLCDRQGNFSISS